MNDGDWVGLETPNSDAQTNQPGWAAERQRIVRVVARVVPCVENSCLLSSPPLSP